MPITLSPALLGAAPPTIPPTLKSVYMIDPGTGWIVGSPVDFSHTPIFYTRPLASILRFASYGGVVGATSTSMVVSTISTTTTAIITSFSTLISGTSVTTTSTSTSSVTGGGIPGFPIESIIAGIAVGLLTLMVLRRRRAKRPEG
jgi:hypothetical protein